MAFTYPITNLEWNGGAVYLYQHPSPYVAPAGYANYTIPLTPSDGVSIEMTIDEEMIYCDQTFGSIDNFKKMTSAVVTISMMRSTAYYLAVGLGLDVTDTTNDYVTSAADRSSFFLASNVVTENQAFFGGVRDNVYYDLQFEKPQSHDTTKIIGFRMPKAIPTGGITWAGKHGETDFYEMKFSALAVDSTISTAIGAVYLNQLLVFFNS